MSLSALVSSSNNALKKAFEHSVASCGREKLACAYEQKLASVRKLKSNIFFIGIPLIFKVEEFSWNLIKSVFFCKFFRKCLYKNNTVLLFQPIRDSLSGNGIFCCEYMSKFGFVL